jgi:hypothetical protein
MYASLDHRQEVRVLPSDQVVQALEAGGLGSDDLKLSERVRAVGSRLEVDAVLVGLVRTYREREGSKFGATGAMVGMEIHLVDSKTGVVLWTGEYFEEQKPLTEDFVGFFEHGGTFVTADVLAKNGLRKLMKELPVGR